MDTNTQNILNLLERATPEDIVTGCQWYNQAQEQAYRIGKALHGVHALELGAAIIAVISPRCRWIVNLEWAWRVVRAVQNDQPVERGGLSPLFPNVEKALAVARSGIEKIPSGQKVSAFYANLTGDYSQVTVDAWAYRIYLGLINITDEVPHTLTAKRYKACAAAYTEVAKLTGYEPAELQAICWVAAHRLEEKGA